MKPMLFADPLQNRYKTNAFSLDPNQNHCKTIALLDLSKTIVKIIVFRLALTKPY